MRIPAALLTLALMTSAPPTPAAPRDALADSRIGLYAGQDFRLATGRCTDCATPPQALWYFADDTIAVPLTDAAGFVATLQAQDDVRQWAYANEWQPDAQKPALIWLGSPLVAHDAQLDADGRMLSFANMGKAGNERDVDVFMYFDFIKIRSIRYRPDLYAIFLTIDDDIFNGQ